MLNKEGLTPVVKRKQRAIRWHRRHRSPAARGRPASRLARRRRKERLQFARSSTPRCLFCLPPSDIALLLPPAPPPPFLVFLSLPSSAFGLFRAALARSPVRIHPFGPLILAFFLRQFPYIYASSPLCVVVMPPGLSLLEALDCGQCFSSGAATYLHPLSPFIPPPPVHTHTLPPSTIVPAQLEEQPLLLLHRKAQRVFLLASRNFLYFFPAPLFLLPV